MIDVVHNLILLRLAVAVLGQRDYLGWWDCQFLSDAGLESLARKWNREGLLSDEGLKVVEANSGVIPAF